MKYIVLIVGASGVGKDTLIKATKENIKANFIKRFITRAPDQNENNFYIDKSAFNALHEKEYFISSWEAHGNCYGIAKEHIKEGLNIISISRGAIKDFEKHFNEVVTINITLPKETLRQRLLERGRESIEQINTRVERSYPKIEAKKLIEFENKQSLEKSIQKFTNIIQSLSDEE